jgi:AcrR family transcriptional regulator
MNKKAEKILGTTTRLFLREGVRRVTMDDIAENAGGSKVTVYKYFVDKDTLYSRVSERIFAHYVLQLEQLLASDDALIAKLNRYIAIVSEFIDSGQFDLCGELARYNSDSEAGYALYVQAYRRAMSALIDEGIADGLVRKDLDKEMCFYYIDMGLLYYQQNQEYRARMLNDGDFQHKFVSFHIGNIFTADARTRLGL